MKHMVFLDPKQSVLEDFRFYFDFVHTYTHIAAVLKTCG